MTEKLLTQAEFAKFIGAHPSHVTRLKHAGRLAMVGLLVDVDASVARIEATRGDREDVAERNALLRSGDDAYADGRIGAGMQAARAVKERYLALEAKRSYETACGRLLVKDEVAATVASMATRFRVALEGLPLTLAPRVVALGGDEAAVEALLSGEVERVLTDLSEGFASIGSASADEERA